MCGLVMVFVVETPLGLSWEPTRNTFLRDRALGWERRVENPPAWRLKPVALAVDMCLDLLNVLLQCSWFWRFLARAKVFGPTS